MSDITPFEMFGHICVSDFSTNPVVNAGSAWRMQIGSMQTWQGKYVMLYMKTNTWQTRAINQAVVQDSTRWHYIFYSMVSWRDTICPSLRHTAVKIQQHAQSVWLRQSSRGIDKIHQCPKFIIDTDYIITNSKLYRYDVFSVSMDNYHE